MQNKRKIIILLVFFLLMPITNLKAITNFASFSLMLQKSTFFDPKIITFDLKLNSNATNINALDARLKFDPQKLKLVSTKNSTSTCKFLVIENIDNIKGEYKIICGNNQLINSATVTTLTFEKLVDGITQINTQANSKVLIADSKGTSIPVINETHHIYIYK